MAKENYTNPTILVLEVDPARSQELVSALKARPYIRILKLDREERKEKKVCPTCDRKFPREITVSPAEDSLTHLLYIIKKMSSFKSVVIANKKNPYGRLSPLDMKRAVEVDDKIFDKLLLLELVAPFVDGSQTTFFATAKALAFLLRKNPLTPCNIVTIDGIAVEKFGEIFIDDVKYKERIDRERLIAAAKRAIGELPPEVITFIENGQMSLV